jgi:hypothetical protein
VRVTLANLSLADDCLVIGPREMQILLMLLHKILE